MTIRVIAVWGTKYRRSRVMRWLWYLDIAMVWFPPHSTVEPSTDWLSEWERCKVLVSQHSWALIFPDPAKPAQLRKNGKCLGNGTGQVPFAALPASWPRSLRQDRLGGLGLWIVGRGLWAGLTEWLRSRSSCTEPAHTDFFKLNSFHHITQPYRRVPITNDRY